MVAIEIRDLVIRYGDFTAVDGLSLRIGRGEVYGLLGPNGAGKTSTFLSLTKQVRIAGGTIRLLGHDIASEFNLVKPRFGYVPDAENHFDEFSAGRNLELYARLYGIDPGRVDACLARVELLREKNLRVASFSKGMRKKLLLARELLHEPELLMLDEPTANLDVHSSELVRDILRAEADRGTAVLITTHNMREVEEVCDRVAIINRGKLIDEDSPIAFKARNTERIIDVALEGGDGRIRTLSVDLTDDLGRRELARLLESEVPLTVHTREFDFHEAFLRLTGEDYN